MQPTTVDQTKKRITHSRSGGRGVLSVGITLIKGHGVVGRSPCDVRAYVAETPERICDRKVKIRPILATDD
jgi:hypothetical protein